MGNVVSVYFNKVIRRNRGGVSAGLTTLSFVYGLSCALQFCGGKTAVDGREGFGTGSRYLSFVYGLACALQFCVGKTAIIWREVFRAGSKCLSFVYGLTCALQFCGGKTAVDGSGGYRAGSISSSSVADKFNFSDFFTETELYKQKRTRSFCLLGRRSASFLRLNEFFRLRNFPERRLNAWGGFGIFPRGDFTFGRGSGFSRKQV